MFDEEEEKIANADLRLTFAVREDKSVFD